MCKAYGKTPSEYIKYTNFFDFDLDRAVFLAAQQQKPKNALPDFEP
ncbi:MAG: hypothetical protein QXT97_02525 [Candidatus Diapherotrites archaeon]